MDKINLHRAILLDELITNATDPVKQMRRFRMLSQLSNYESQVIGKIAALDTNEVDDFLTDEFEREINTIVNRNA